MFKDILRGKLNEVRCVAVKGQEVRMEKERHWVRVIMRKQRQFYKVRRSQNWSKAKYQ